MTLGEKIKELRINKGISQEKLAENLNVSRSSIAKWETNGGIPEISNLILIADFFDVSLDVLFDNAKESNITAVESVIDCNETEYFGKYYDIELTGWNDGVYDVLIVNEDDKFLFYIKRIKDKSIYGLIGKKYIASISASKNADIKQELIQKIDRYYFLKKHITMALTERYFDSRKGDYRDVIISSYDETKIKLQFGNEIALNEITKIEEIL